MKNLKTFFSANERTEDRVREILSRFPETRDSDELLVWVYWKTQRGDLDNMSISTFRQLFFKGFEALTRISRSRRRVQEGDPSLRGQLYGKKKKDEAFYRLYYSPRVSQLSILESPDAEFRDAMESIYQGYEIKT